MRKFTLILRMLVAVLVLCNNNATDLAAQNNRYRMSFDVSPSPLDIFVGRVGSIQIYRDGVEQLYNPNNSPNNRSMFNGVFLLDDNYLVATRSDALDGWNARWTGTVSGVSGSGTMADPWAMTAFLSSNDGGLYDIDITYSYVDGNDFFDVSLVPTVPAGNTDTIKIFHIFDTFLDGSDNGSAYTTGVSPHSVVGVQSATNIEAFIVGNRQWDRYSSHFYYTVLNEPFYDGQLSNILDTDVTTDNAAGVQWTLGVVSGVQPAITYRIGFSDNPMEFSCGSVKMNVHLPAVIRN